MKFGCVLWMGILELERIFFFIEVRGELDLSERIFILKMLWI